MNNIILKSLALAALVGLASCNDFVQGIEQPISSVDDALLNNPNQIPFLMAGVRAQFNTVVTDITVDAAALSDEMIFDPNVPGATYTQFAEMESGNILLDNTSIETTAIYLGQLRLYADTLIARVERLQVKDTTLRNQGLYTGYLYSGIARYFWAAYFGLSENEGGGVISGGPFIPSSAMYDEAIDCFKGALKYASSSYEERVANTLMAKVYLNREMYADARAAASNGLMPGDDPLDAAYNDEVWNGWWSLAGAGRTQLVADPRFAAYIEQDPSEAGRIQLAEVEGYDGSIYYRQDKYPLEGSPFSFITWQENELILAELDIRDGEGTSALSHVNAVRASHQVSDLPDVIDLDKLYEERDKELFATGNRLIDQRRFDRWHLPEGTWRYLPIPQAERNSNPNL